MDHQLIVLLLDDVVSIVDDHVVDVLDVIIDNYLYH